MPPRPAPTHFLCIPLAGSQLARSLASFRADITSPSPAGFDVPEQAVRPPGTLHLTLGVMTLRDDDGSLARAVDLLRCLRLRDVLEQARTATATAAAAAGARAVAPRTTTRPPAAGERLSVTLQGLQAMQRPSETSVLYAPPADPTGVLRRFCESLRRVFQEAGLMAEEQRPLLLHATVVNTVYVRGQRRQQQQQQQQRGRGSSSNNNGRQNGGGRRERMTIDARDIIARYDDYVWVEDMPVGKVAICRMGARRIEGTDGDEAYEVEAQVSLRGS